MMLSTSTAIFVSRFVQSLGCCKTPLAGALVLPEARDLGWGHPSTPLRGCKNRTMELVDQLMPNQRNVPAPLMDRSAHEEMSSDDVLL